MSKKIYKSPEIINNRNTNETNQLKNPQIKNIVSPYKRNVVNNVKSPVNKKNPSLLSTKSKITSENNGNQTQYSQNLVQKNTGQYSKLQNGLKSSKKNSQLNKVSQNNKNFTKTSKIITLKTTPTKQVTQQTDTSKLKQTKDTIQQKLPSSLYPNQLLQKSNSTIQTLKSQIQTLKKQNQQLKKQNDKLLKKIEKLKNLSDENKRLLKQRIQSFNCQGQNLRKFKEEINQKTNEINLLNEEIRKINQINNSLRNDLAQLCMPKKQQQQVQKQQVINDKMKQQLIQQRQKQMKQLQKNYQSSSSRQSFGGILPLQTVIKQIRPRFRINFKNQKSQQIQRKDELNQQQRSNKNKSYHLLQKYENYWSQKVENKMKQQDNQNQQQGQYQQVQNEQQQNIHSQIPKLRKKQSSQDQNKLLNKNYFSFDLNLLKNTKYPNPPPVQNQTDNNQILKRIAYQKSIHLKEYQFQCDQNLNKQKEIHFSPTILIQNYKRISDQQQLIKSLYQVIEQLTKQVEVLAGKNDKLNVRVKELVGKEKQGNVKNQGMDGGQQTQKKNYQHLDDLIKNQTMLLDDTVEEKEKERGNVYKDKKELSQNYLIKDSNQQKNNNLNIISKNHIYETENQRNGNQQQKSQQQLNQPNNKHSNSLQRFCYSEQYQSQQIKIIDDISRFVYSQNLHQFKGRGWNNGLDEFNNQKQNMGNQIKNNLIKQGKQELNVKQESNIKEDMINANINPVQNTIIQKSQLKLQKSIIKLQDSLQALQYFSRQTPNNYSSQVSQYLQKQQNQNNQPVLNILLVEQNNQMVNCQSKGQNYVTINNQFDVQDQTKNKLIHDNVDKISTKQDELFIEQNTLSINKQISKVDSLYKEIISYHNSS